MIVETESKQSVNTKQLTVTDERREVDLLPASFNSPSNKLELLGSFRTETGTASAEGQRAFVLPYMDTVTVSPNTLTTVVQHIGQFHKFPGMGENPVGMEKVAQSQFEVAKFLIGQTNCTILSENVSEDYTPSVRPILKPMCDVVREQIFPAGLPATFDKCSPLQRNFLAEEGGDRTLYFLGEITHLYAAVSGQERADIESRLQPFKEKYGPAFGIAVQTDPEVKSLVMDGREKACLTRAGALVGEANSTGKSVLIVFGAAHDFSDEFSAQNGFSFRKIDYSHTTAASGGNSPFAMSSTITRDRTIITNCPPYETFKGDSVNALREYSNLLFDLPSGGAGGLRDNILSEQQRAVSSLLVEKKQVSIGTWLHCGSPELKLQILPLLDPKRIDGNPYTVSDMHEEAQRSPALKDALDSWLKKNESSIPARGYGNRQGSMP